MWMCGKGPGSKARVGAVVRGPLVARCMSDAEATPVCMFCRILVT